MMISMAPHYEEVKNSGKLSSLSIFFFWVHDCEITVLTCANVTLC